MQYATTPPPSPLLLASHADSQLRGQNGCRMHVFVFCFPCSMRVFASFFWQGKCSLSSLCLFLLSFLPRFLASFLPSFLPPITYLFIFFVWSVLIFLICFYSFLIRIPPCSLTMFNDDLNMLSSGAEPHPAALALSPVGLGSHTADVWKCLERDGKKTAHLSNIVERLVGFLNLAILMRQLQAGYHDFLTTSY